MKSESEGFSHDFFNNVLLEDTRFSTWRRAGCTRLALVGKKCIDAVMNVRVYSNANKTSSSTREIAGWILCSRAENRYYVYYYEGSLLILSFSLEKIESFWFFRAGAKNSISISFNESAFNCHCHVNSFSLFSPYISAHKKSDVYKTFILVFYQPEICAIYQQYFRSVLFE